MAFVQGDELPAQLRAEHPFHGDGCRVDDRDLAAQGVCGGGRLGPMKPAPMITTCPPRARSARRAVASGEGTHEVQSGVDLPRRGPRIRSRGYDAHVVAALGVVLEADQMPGWIQLCGPAAEPQFDVQLCGLPAR
ncbi:hypothetical protein [Streptomyces mirabilis]|uniref:hypothetical protein n=1 Tax=Streptomyces mirabilis TaxID=68239 RepID=UPI00210AEC3A|nr:hypothetical protein [Streptomyces mirabilis]